MKLTIRATFAALLMAVACFPANASITLVGTRVIYPASEREVTVRMNNVGADPRVVQSWIDDGDSSANAENAKSPFLITPPLSRIEPGKGQTLRISFLGGNVPQDRESIYWLNVLEIPPKPSADTNNYLQFAIRTRVKIFYRPEGLSGDPDTAADQLVWRLVKEGGGHAMECTNNSPYNIAINDARFKDAPDDRTLGRGGVCPAKGRQTFPLKGGNDTGRLVYRVINDFGAIVDKEANYSR